MKTENTALSKQLGFLAGLGTALVLSGGLLSGCSKPAAEPEQGGVPSLRTFQVTGTIKRIPDDRQSAVIEHEEIPGYMDAMIMPFQVKDTNLLAETKAGDAISFRLNVTKGDSWIDQISVVGRAKEEAAVPVVNNAVKPPPTSPHHPLRDFPYTNELSQATHIRDFEGRALGITFFFTRCPIPNYCPRLTQNFATASERLKAMPDAPTNWHFLSVTIDPEHDTPAVLKAYGERYNYDPAHWSFLTGPAEELEALAQQSGVTMGWEGNLLNHNFRTLIIDATGRLQMSFPMGGDLSDAIVSEIIKAASVSPTP